ncbi:MAG: SpoIIE family protein phosphatase [Solirubrobacteraceae bacterium]
MRVDPDILLADDDDVGRYVIATMLRRAGFAVRETSDGAQAVSAALQRPPALALLDVKMPVMNGFEACRRLKSHERTRHVPVLLLSATFMDTEAQVEGLETGADAYLTQPVEAPVLAATVRSLLRARHAESDVRHAALEWRTTFDAISDAVAVLDAGLALARVNRSFATLFGAKLPEALVGRRLADLSRPLALIVESGSPGEIQLGARTQAVRVDEIPRDPEVDLDAQLVLTLSDVTSARRAESEHTEALRRERTISRTLQQSLLPERLPRQPRLHLDAWHVAAEKELIIGGDWYDVIETGSSVWLVIGDVAGHGVAAATQAGQLRHSLRVYAHEGFGLGEAMSRLNELVLGTELTGMATMCIAAVDLDTGALRLVRAGHPPPLLIRADAEPELLEGHPGVVLGVAGSSCDEYAMQLQTGDRLVLYTDGLIELPPESLDVGLCRLLDAARGLEGLRSLRNGIVDEMVDVANLRDDVAMLLAERA